MGRCLSCSLYTILGCIAVPVAILALLVWIFGIGNLIVLFTPHPRIVNPTVDSATLSQFTLSPNSVLRYNLTLNMTIRNPDKHIDLYYKKAKSLALFEDQRFGYTWLDTFYLERKSSTQVAVVFHGQQLIDGSVTAASFRSQQASGVFNVDVKINARIGKVFGAFVINGPRVSIFCPLLLPSPVASNASTTFGDCRISF